MSQDELLLLLRDIDAPPEPAWWLPGPGHYLLLAVLALGLATAWLGRMRRRRNYWRRVAAAELARIERDHRRHGDAAATARALSAWLRRVCLLAFPEQAPAGLVGEDWLRFLDRQQGAEGFERGVGRVLAGGAYRREVRVDIAALFTLCAGWLQSVAPALPRGAPRRAGLWTGR